MLQMYLSMLFYDLIFAFMLSLKSVEFEENKK